MRMEQAVAQLRQYATSRKVVSSIPDGVGIFIDLIFFAALWSWCQFSL